MYDAIENVYSKPKKGLNLDALVEKLNDLYEQGDTERIMGYGKICSQKMLAAKNDPEKAMTYLKGAINAYFFLEDYGNIEKIIKAAKNMGLSRPNLLKSETHSEDEVKIMKIINDVYGAQKFKKPIKKAITTKNSYKS